MATGMKHVAYLDSKRIQGRNGYVNGICGASADLTVTGATQNTTGKIGKCIDFDGTNDYATAQSLTDDHCDFNFMHKGNSGKKPKWTVSFWLNVDGTTPSSNEFLFGDNDGTDVGFCFRMNGSSSLKITLAATSGNYLARAHMPSIIDNDSNWHHYVVTYDNTISVDSLNIWVDGTKENAAGTSDNNRESTITSNSNQDHAFRIGMNADSASGHFRGKFDEMSFWDRTLTDTEIEDELYDGTNAGITTTDAVYDLTGLRVFYNFNEASGNVKNVTTSDLDNKTSLTNVAANTVFEGIDDYYSYTYSGSEWLPRKITAPTEISDCIAWWDMSDTSNTSVSRVKDKTGNNFHLTQTNSSYRPTIQTNQQNSLQALRFNEHDDHIGCGTANTVSSTGFSITTPCTIFWVGNLRATGTTDTSWDFYLWDMGDIGRFVQYQSNWRIALDNSGYDTYAWSDSTRGNYTVNNWAYITTVFDHSSEATYGISDAYMDSRTSGQILRCNGVETKTAGLGENGMKKHVTWFNLNAYSTGNTKGCNQDVGEVIIFQRRLKPAEILSVENYIKDKWDL